jgi:hypothetical protein
MEDEAKSMGPYTASACVQSHTSALTALTFVPNADSENLVTEQSLAVLKAKIKVTTPIHKTLAATVTVLSPFPLLPPINAALRRSRGPRADRLGRRPAAARRSE